MVVPALTLLAFSDKRALGGASEGLTSGASSHALLHADATSAQVAAARAQRVALGCLTTSHIPPLVAFGDLLSMLGSGMTVRRAAARPRRRPCHARGRA